MKKKMELRPVPNIYETQGKSINGEVFAIYLLNQANGSFLLLWHIYFQDNKIRKHV